MKLGVEFTLGALLGAFITIGCLASLYLPQEHAKASASRGIVDDLKQCQERRNECYVSLKKSSDTIESSMAETTKIACVCSRALGIPLDKRIKCEP